MFKPLFFYPPIKPKLLTYFEPNIVENWILGAKKNVKNITN